MQLNQYLSTLYLFSRILLLRPKVSVSAVQYSSVHLMCEGADRLLSNRPPTPYTHNESNSRYYFHFPPCFVRLRFHSFRYTSALVFLFTPAVRFAAATAPFTCPSIASTSSYCFVKQRAVCIINVWGYTEMSPEDHTLINLLLNTKLYMTRSPA